MKTKTKTKTKTTRKNKTAPESTIAYRPIGARCIVRRFDVEQTSKGGIVLVNPELSLEGTVLSVGDGTKDEPMELQVGDTVLFGKYAGVELKIDGDPLLILNQNDVLCVKQGVQDDTVA